MFSHGQLHVRIEPGNDGCIGCWQVYKEKLRELKRACRSLLKRVGEAEKRPKLINQLLESINISFSFATKMRNVTEDMQIFTEVEITSLETLTNESMVGVALSLLLRQL